MNFFGLTFVLYFLKLSDVNGFLDNLRNTEHKVYKETIKVERLLLKLRKYNAIYYFWLNVEIKICTQNLSNINTLRTNRINTDIDITDVVY